MKVLQKLVFEALKDMDPLRPKKRPARSSNALKEIKATFNCCLTDMAEITGLKIGKRDNASLEKAEKYENIVYKLSHQYSNMFPKYLREEIFEELTEAGFEGVAHGIKSYTNGKGTMRSTFVFSRVKFAIQKQVAVINRRSRQAGTSINALIDPDENTDFQELISANQASTEEIVERKIMRETLQREMDSLDPRDKYILSLCGELSVPAVSKQTHIPISQINALLQSVRARLQNSCSLLL
jgi:RNA polymerase sigma factor (sigma-70 family)